MFGVDWEETLIGKRLLSKVDFTDEGCWEWQAGKDGGGYGSVMIRRKRYGVHRLAYLEWVGPIPEGMEIDHLCRNRKCFNPYHLEAVTGRINKLRGIGFVAKHALATHCPKGHPYDETNTYVRKGTGYRDCKTCLSDRSKARWKRAYELKNEEYMRKTFKKKKVTQ